MKKLAAATEFTPGIVELARVVQIVLELGPDRDAVVEAIRQEYFVDSALGYEGERRLTEQTKRANNVLIGMREYGLVDRSNQPEALARELASLDAVEQYERLASHVLKELGGIDVLRAVEALQARGVPVNKDSLAGELRVTFGYDMPRDTTKHTNMLGWLRKAGVLPPRGYEINSERVSQLAGIRLRPLEEWQAMPLAQEAFLQALRRLSMSRGATTQPVRSILNQAEEEYGHLYFGAKTAAAVLGPLEAQGWITVSGSSGGRGAKSGLVEPTQKLLDFDPEVANGFTVPAIPSDLRTLINRPMPEIAASLKSANTYDAGIALELLTLRMCLALGLSPIEFRKRDDKTGGGEVDLLAEGVHLHFSRWLFQCKNQKSVVTLGALAKEVGMAVLLQAHVIVLATTGRFAGSVQTHADQVTQTTAMQVVLVDGVTIDQFSRGSDDAIKRHFRSGAAQTLRLKEPQRKRASAD